MRTRSRITIQSLLVAVAIAPGWAGPVSAQESPTRQRLPRPRHREGQGRWGALRPDPQGEEGRIAGRGLRPGRFAPRRAARAGRGEGAAQVWGAARRAGLPVRDRTAPLAERLHPRAVETVLDRVRLGVSDRVRPGTRSGGGL